MKYFLCVVGMVMIVEGLPYFSFPDKMKQVVNMVSGQEDAALRKFGFIRMIVGLLLLYVGKVVADVFIV
ncbi:MAG: DUF2065 domain-containing protein [Desulfobacula sp.]|jgi:uncharacterized protein|nr:DUF2065 domain-containing protein [Desulfobacula sp.]